MLPDQNYYIKPKFMKKKTTVKMLAFTLTILLSVSLKAQFVNPVPIPYLMTGTTFNLKVDTSSHNFNPYAAPSDSLNVNLKTFCYNQADSNSITYLGPTMIWPKGKPIQINVTNNLPGSETTVHWHGLNLPGEMDGGPHEVIASGGVWNPAFSIIDPIQTVWYHSHLMDSTTEQVIMGLAGMIIIEDTLNDNLRNQLPNQYNKNDFPIVIQEKAFLPKVNGKVSGIKAINTPGNGITTLINGVTRPYLTVPKSMVRLRVLNGSPRKSFHLGFSDILSNPVSFDTTWLIATDGGYTPQPFPMDSFLISPGERMEMVVNFTNIAHGDTLYLSNLVRSMPLDIVVGQGVPQTRAGTPGSAFLALIVDTNIKPNTPVYSLPSTLLPYTIDTVTNVVKKRTKHLINSSTGSGSGGQWTIDSVPMNMSLVNDTIWVDKKEMWTIINTTDVAHPFHIHKVQFQVVRYTGFLGTDSTTYGTYTYPNLPSYMMGYKDDILIRGYSSMTFVASFDSFPSMMVDTMMAFMYHCHILTHEDNSMMHQFVVVDSLTYHGQGGTMGVNKTNLSNKLTLFPNPAGDMIYLKGSNIEAGTVRISDLLGRTLKEVKLKAFDGSTSVSVADLPRGVVFVEWSSGDKRSVQKIILH